MTLNLGPNTTAPLVTLGVSVDHQPFVSMNATAGANVIPVSLRKSSGATTVVRINAEMYFNSQMNLESIDLNSVCALEICRKNRLLLATGCKGLRDYNGLQHVASCCKHRHVAVVSTREPL